MPLSQIDTDAALIVIDLQKGIAAMPAVHPAREIIARAARLARGFREQGLPVVLVNVTGAPPGRTDGGRRTFNLPADWTELVAELDVQSSDYKLSKQSPGAFIGTSLDEYLRQRDVTQVFVVGISTSVGVESTARSAFDHGYNVVLVVDAMTDRNEDAHRHSVEKVFPRIGETTMTEVVLRMLKERGEG